MDGISEAERLALWKQQMAADFLADSDDDVGAGGAAAGAGAGAGGDDGGDSSDGSDTEAAAVIRARYGLQPRAGGKATGGGGPSGGVANGGGSGDSDGKFQGNFDWAGFSQVQELTEKNTELLGLLDMKTREIARLEELVIATEAVPGLDVEALMAAQKEGVPLDADPRDVKIMHLSKRNRRLNLALQRQKSKAKQAAEDVAKLKAVADSKVYPKRLQPSTATASPGGDGTSSSPRPTAAAAAAAEVKAMGARVEAMRQKLERSQEELKATQRALTAELGPDVSVAEAVEAANRRKGTTATSSMSAATGSGAGGGWRGRAQKIVVLKSKLKAARAQIRELRERAGLAPTDDSATVATRRTAATATTSASHRFDVDDAARADLQEMGRERARAVEAVTVELEHRNVQVEALSSKLDAARARTKVLEGKHAEMKAAIKSLLSKASNDDKLVDALRAKVTAMEAREREAQVEAESLRFRLKDAMGFFDKDRSASPSSKPSAPPRPPSKVRRGARAMVEVEEARSRCRMLTGENSQLRHLVETAKARLREVETQQEAYIARVSELEIRCSEAEQAAKRHEKKSRRKDSSDSGPSREELLKSVQTLQSERDALRATFREAVSSRDEEIASLQRLLEEQRHELYQAMARMTATADDE